MTSVVWPLGYYTLQLRNSAFDFIAKRTKRKTLSIKVQEVSDLARYTYELNHCWAIATSTT